MPLAPELAARAPAKVNLSLHVLGRRADGYHDLESLVAFAGTADSVMLTPDAPLALSTAGPMAALAGPETDNLVLRAARCLAGRVAGLRLGAFHLVKRLPVAAGLGGGSADAAAALRLLARLNRLPPAHPALREAARVTGADVSVCLVPRARMMRGLGDRLGPVLGLPSLPAVLVNPGVPVATPAVFKGLNLAAGEARDTPAHPAVGAGEGVEALIRRLAEARNDLEPPALAIAPVIGEALALLRRQAGCRLARMSGSGATVFAIFCDRDAARAAARTVGRERSGWWVRATVLR